MDAPYAESSTTLTNVVSVHRLSRDEAQKGIPVKIRGVTTCVQPGLHAFVIQDDTAGLYVVDRSRTNELPNVGDLVQVEGYTEPGQAVLQSMTGLGTAPMPEPQRPSWNQLMNGGLSCRWAEIEGLSESVHHRSNGWSRVNFRTRDGVIHVELRRAGLRPVTLDQCQNTVIRLRGCVFADSDAKTHFVKAGQIRMYDAEIITDDSMPSDLFSLPRKSASDLRSFDPDMSTLRRVKVSGQVVFVRGFDCFVMDGNEGMRFISNASLGLKPGDLVEAVGFPEWGYASPVLRGVVARKTGHAELPPPKKLSPDDLIRSHLDATRVQVDGVLSSSHSNASGQVMEMQSGSWRFLARISSTNVFVQTLPLGSRLRLTGVYCAQGGYAPLGEDVAPVDLLIESPSDIQVLALPPWWTLPRVLAVAGMLAFLLVAALLWVTQLRRKVEQRTAELQAQIQNRERAEHQRALEQERARIARDLHDELGADITEVGMLANRTRCATNSDEERHACLGQLAEKSEEMVSALEELVWAMNPQHDSLESVVSYYSFYANRFLHLANIRLHLEASAGALDLVVDAGVRHQLFLVLKEALTNVVNHSRATEVRLSIGMENDELTVSVADNGRGISGLQPASGQDGTANMRLRVEKLRGHFEIAGQPGRGTTLKVAVPLNGKS
jgi:signal transduction histidine kinase